MTFHVGQKIVCIDDNWGKPGDNPVWAHLFTMPRKDVIYHVRGYYPFPVPPECKTAPFIFLAEIVNPPSGAHVEYGKSYVWTSEVAFSAHSFRPVIERQTDISALTALLNPANHKILERA